MSATVKNLTILVWIRRQALHLHATARALRAKRGTGPAFEHRFQSVSFLAAGQLLTRHPRTIARSSTSAAVARGLASTASTQGTCGTASCGPAGALREFSRFPGWDLGRLGRTTGAVALTFAVAASVACRPAGTEPAQEGASGPSRAAVGSAGTITPGGGIVASIHTDPRTFNRYLKQDASSDLVATLTHAKLVRLNRVTQDIEPWLAESWSAFRRRPALHDEAAAERVVLGRPPLHVRRCVVFVRGGVR